MSDADNVWQFAVRLAADVERLAVERGKLRAALREACDLAAELRHDGEPEWQRIAELRKGAGL